MFGIYLLAACDVVNSGPIQLRAELRFQHDSVLEMPFSFAQQVQLASNRVDWKGRGLSGTSGPRVAIATVCGGDPLHTL